MLAACVSERVERKRRPLDLPVPADRDSQHQTLVEFGVAVVRELSPQEVLTTYRRVPRHSDFDRLNVPRLQHW